MEHGKPDFIKLTGGKDNTTIILNIAKINHIIRDDGDDVTTIDTDENEMFVNETPEEIWAILNG